jgi:uncharacterized cofD-like protein
MALGSEIPVGFGRNLADDPGTRLAVAQPMLPGLCHQSAGLRYLERGARTPRIVAVGGGTGLPTVLRGLRHAAETFGWNDLTDGVTAIVTVMDDGGSSGILRKSMGILPPGDIRNCLGALVRRPSLLSGILHDRLGAEGPGHPIGNLLLAALTRTEGDLLRAVRSLGALMNVSGRVLPATLDDVDLTAALEDGEAIRGESAITARGGRIGSLRLDHPVRPLPEAIEAIVNADLVVVGPGSLYTSILPNLLVDGIASTLSGITAPRVYVANLMTEPGETDDYSLSDHLRVIREHTGFDLFDYVLVNRGAIPPAALAAYASEGSFVIPLREHERIGGAQVMATDIATVTPYGQIRHDPAALGLALTALLGSRSIRASTLS